MDNRPDPTRRWGTKYHLNMAKPAISILWLKRDLRWQDHTALQSALQARLPILAVYLKEPTLWAQIQYSDRQWQFVWDSVASMNDVLGQQKVHALTCEAIEFFEGVLPIVLGDEGAKDQLLHGGWVESNLIRGRGGGRRGEGRRCINQRPADFHSRAAVFRASPAPPRLPVFGRCETCRPDMANNSFLMCRQEAPPCGRMPKCGLEYHYDAANPQAERFYTYNASRGPFRGACHRSETP